MQKLNGTVKSGSKAEAYKLLVKAADMGHKDARVMVAWAQLLGSYLPLNIDEAKKTFEELAEIGVPDGHMVGFFSA
jgi:SEL1 protein